VNSEELELSLRTEFESYLKNTIAEMKQEVSEFQQKIESEFEKHKSHIDETVKEFSEKFGDEHNLEESFRDSVSEHLKLAREEGSKITANAFAEAEKLREDEQGDTTAQFADIRDAIAEISSKDSQSEILKSLVHHATQFTPRGAFFIVKNEHLVGWRMFGTEEHANPQVVREVFFPVNSKTALSESIETLATVQGSSDANEDDLLYLNKLGFEHPENMYAIPLVARGRGVAVLYADNGTEGGSVNVEVLETLMRVAGLTVEVLASTQIAKTHISEQPAYAPVQEHSVEENRYSEGVSQPAFEESPKPETEDFGQTDFTSEPDSVEEFQAESPIDEPVEEVSYETESPAESSYVESSYEDNSWQQPVEEPVQEFTPADSLSEDYSTSYESDAEDSVNSSEDYSIDINQSYDTNTEFDSTQFGSFEESNTEVEDTSEIHQIEEEVSTEPSYEFETTSNDESSDSYTSEDDFETVSGEDNYEVSSPESEVIPDDFSQDDESVEVETASVAPPVRTRFGDRNVDLPIEVAEDERRLHNDARRFARLLVSEIKLYNEQKVKEGRESSDLYERLREAIDRSREMYDKRVQPPVAAKFDYFNYELINTLAEGDEGKLGGSYPGGSV
jgi:hypothetical protein